MQVKINLLPEEGQHWEILIEGFGTDASYIQYMLEKALEVVKEENEKEYNHNRERYRSFIKE